MGYSVPAPFDPSSLEDEIDQSFNQAFDVSMINSFRLAVVGSLAGPQCFNDGYIDELEDESGVDTGSCVDQAYDSSNDLYKTDTPSTETTWALGGDTGYLTLMSAISGLSMGFSFTPSGDRSVASVEIECQAVSGPQDIIAKVFTDNAGSPNVQTGTSSNPVTPSIATLTFTFSTPVPVSGSTKYWIVISPVSTPNTNCQIGAVNGSASYESGRHDTITSISNSEYPGSEGRDWKFVINYSALTGMELLTNKVDAEANDPVSARVIIFVDLNGETITENTDLKAYVSMDDGSNFDQVTLVQDAAYESGKSLYVGTVDLTARGDKQMVLKITVHNSKDIYIEGWAILWRY